MANQNSSNNGGSSNSESLTNNERPAKKGRGLARKTHEWGKTKLNIEVDDDWHPCGGDYNELATQIGYFMKDGYSFPLTESWKDMDLLNIERVWKEIQDNTNLPLESKKVCIDSMARSWRDWKCRVKRKGFHAYDTDEERLANCPDGVVAQQWSSLVPMWNLKKSKKVASVNTVNALKQDFWHATGKKPLSVLKKQLSEQGKPTDRLSVFIASRSGTKREDTQQMLGKLEHAVKDMPTELQDDPQAREKIFVDIFGKDTHGRMRCMGIGITPTMIYGRKGGATSGESVTNVRAEFEQKMELQKQEMEILMQKERDAYKIEMEARIQAERDANRLEMEDFKKQIFSQLQSQYKS